MSPEIQKSKTTTTKHDAADMQKVIAASSVTNGVYTCSICSQQVTGLQQFKMHLLEAHNAVNKEPQHQ